MANQKFTLNGYQKPGVYTRTTYASDNFNTFSGTTIPVLIGEASDLVLREDVPVVRGLSNSFPIFVEREDLSYQVTLGNTQVLKTKFGPIVNPENSQITNEPQYVTVQIDNDFNISPTKVVGLNSLGETEIHLPYIPEGGSKIYVSYYYTRTSKSVDSEDVSTQANGTNKIFYTKNKNLISSDEVITNNVKDITVIVNGDVAVVTYLNGHDGIFELQDAPSGSSEVYVSYNFNPYSRVLDPLPNKFVHSIVRIGKTPQRSDYTNNVDYSFGVSIDENGNKNNSISWGNYYTIEGLQSLVGSEFENDIVEGNHIDIQVIDRKIYAEVLKPIITEGDPTKVTVFESKYTITDGTGQGNYLTGSGHSANILSAYSGVTPFASLPDQNTVLGNVAQIKLVDGVNKRIYLKTPVNPKATNIYLVYHTNDMRNESYRIQKNTSGQDPVYTIKSESSGNYPKLSFNGINAYNETIFYSLSYDDMYAPISQNLAETITVTFSDLDSFNVTEIGSASSSFLVKSAIPETDALGDLLRINFESSITRNFKDFKGQISITTTGFSNAANNVSGAEVVTGGINFLTIRMSSPGVLESILIPSGTISVVGNFLDSVTARKFTVTSNQASLTGSDTSLDSRYSGTLREGLAKNEGILGEPYVDPVTGVSFTLKYTPDFDFSTGNSLNISLTSGGDYAVDPNRFVYLKGVRFRINNLDNVEDGEGLTIVTNNYRSEAQPEEGSIYYVSYYYYRLNFNVSIYQSLIALESDFGRPNLDNPISLAGKLAFENGAPFIAVKPLGLYTDETFDEYLATRTNDPATQELERIELFKQAIESLGNPLAESSNLIPYYFVPLTANISVLTYLKEHVEEYSDAIGYSSERYMIYGSNPRTTDLVMANTARGLKSNRVMAMYPNSGVVSIEDQQGFNSSITVPGYYYAAAIAGMLSRPDITISTSLTKRTVLGFSDLGQPRNRLVLNNLASSGLTIIEKNDPVFQIRDALNTDLDSATTREPTVTFTGDFIERTTRRILDRFIAEPFTNSIIGNVESVFSSYLRYLQQSNYIVAYQNLKVEIDDNDPTILRLSVEYSPTFPIKYILVDFYVRGKLG